MIEIELNNDESFLIIKETLQRIGLTNRDMNMLIQTCHILHKKGKYYIVHFKEMLHLDGGELNLDILDINRVKYITSLLADWNLCTPIDNTEHVFDSTVRIVPFKEKDNWLFRTKYKMGIRRKYDGEFR